MTVELRADQSQRSTTPSCAFHRSVLLPGFTGLMKSSLPLPNRTWSPSGPHARQYTAASRCSRVDRSIPLRPHTLSAPSSPTVASAVPSAFQRTEMAAPRCASTDFSTRPPRETILNVPSEQDAANTSLPATVLLLAPGNHCISVTYPSMSHTLPPASPFMSQRHTVWSSLHEYSSLNAFHPTAETSSWCGWLAFSFSILSFIFPLAVRVRV
mmetsp:Transcript_25987/g.65068  ORF Transcript_25987/g.65068 Transcript_25987/m.65068 type:complete len:212 (+) Transcript_25987:1884-2519(+)